MRYVASDLHGEAELLFRLLDRIRFSATDELLICGDILDKGPEPARLAAFVFSQPNIRCIAGNHEHAFINRYHSLLRRSPHDFDAVLAELRADLPDGRLLDWETVDALEALPYFIEEEGLLCVHAGVPLDARGALLPASCATPEFLVNDRRFKEPDVCPAQGPCVFFGHTPTVYFNGRSEILAYPRPGRTRAERFTDYSKVHLDVGTWLSGVMGCFCTDTCLAHYVSRDS